MTKQRVQMRIDDEVLDKINQMVNADLYKSRTDAVESIIKRESVEAPTGMSLVLIPTSMAMEITFDGQMGLVKALGDLLKTRNTDDPPNHLNHRHRAMWYLRHINGWTYQQIADAFGLSRQRVEQILK